MVINVGSTRMDYDKARELEGKMTSRAVARLIGVHHSTIARWWKRLKPPRQIEETVTLDDLGLQRCNGKLCRRCGDPMRIKTGSGLCTECGIAELAKQGRVKIDG